MGVLRRSAGVFFYLLEVAAALAVLYWSFTRLQTTPSPPSPSLLSYLLGIHLQSLSNTSAFLLGNAIVLAIILLSGRRDPPPPSTPLPPSPAAHGGEAHPDDFTPVLPQEVVVSYEDKAVYAESSLATAHAPAAATWVIQKGRLSRRTKPEQLAGAVTVEGPWERPLRLSEAAVVMEEEEDEEEEDEEKEERDEFREMIEAFICKQTSFIKGEEAMLLLAAESSSSAAMVATGGP